jgi:hypothetical protein
MLTQITQPSKALKSQRTPGRCRYMLYHWSFGFYFQIRRGMS